MRDASGIIDLRGSRGESRQFRDKHGGTNHYDSLRELTQSVSTEDFIGELDGLKVVQLAHVSLPDNYNPRLCKGVYAGCVFAAMDREVLEQVCYTNACDWRSRGMCLTRGGRGKHG